MNASVALIVKLDILSVHEYERLAAGLRAELEAATETLVQRYGEASLRTWRERCRAELRFGFSIELDNPPQEAPIFAGVSDVRPRP